MFLVSVELVGRRSTGHTKREVILHAGVYRYSNVGNRAKTELEKTDCMFEAHTVKQQLIRLAIQKKIFFGIISHTWTANETSQHRNYRTKLKVKCGWNLPRKPTPVCPTINVLLEMRQKSRKISVTNYVLRIFAFSTAGKSHAPFWSAKQDIEPDHSTQRLRNQNRHVCILPVLLFGDQHGILLSQR